MYTFSRLQTSDLPLLTKLLDIGFSIKNKDKTAPVSWKFFLENSFPVTAFVAKHSQKIVSFYANKRLPIRYGEIRYESGVCLDMTTAPEHRRQGLIKKLSSNVYEQISKHGVAFSFGFSNAQGIKVDSNYSGYGYHVVGQFIELLFPSFFSNTPQSTYNLKKVTHFTNTQSAFENYAQIDPSTEYLTWRYHEKPGANYTIYELYEETSFLGYVIMSSGLFSLHIVKITADITSLHLPAFTSLLKNHANKSKKWFVVLYVLENSFWQKMKKNTVCMSRYHPKYFFTLKPIRIPSSKLSTLLDPNTWMIMGGDII